MKRLQQQQHKKNGFSMPEVLVSSTILMMVVAGTAQSQLTSFAHTANAGQQNAVQTRISEDLDTLRREAFKWQCTDKTSCTGNVQFEDVPMRYNTNEPELIAACATKTMGTTIITKKSNIFPESSILNWGNNAPQKNQNVTINRTISADNNEIQVTYTTAGSSRNITTTTSIIPQAASWCA